MKQVAILLMVLIMIIATTACQGQPDTTQEVVSSHDENLVKLAKVWGFAKYTHPAFLTSEKCWDEELLYLIPIVYLADADDVNNILYDWFASLGDDGYENRRIVIVEVQLNMPWHLIANAEQLLNEIQGLSLLSTSYYNNTITLRAQIDEGSIPYLDTLGWISSVEIIDENDINFRQMADFSWINEAYLGLPLFERLSRFQAIRPFDRANAPVYFDSMGNSVFTNQQNHENMDYGDVRYRLLGLFRMWSAIEYYFPYRDILDRDWHELLLEHTVMMREGTDRLSYELTLASLSMHMHDVHVVLRDAVFMSERFGQFFIPIRLTEAEGQLVVRESISAVNGEFLSGDIILELDGTDISEVTADMLQFLSFPNEEKALAYIAFYWGLMSHARIADIDIMRGDTVLSLQIETTDEITIGQRNPIPSSIFLENNIGMINPWHLAYDNEIHDIMRDFTDTDGLIVDLRQYPRHFAVYSLLQYILYDNQPFAIISAPSQFTPGVFMDLPYQYAGPQSHYEGTYFYDKPVVILMNEQTLSAAEYLVMILRTGPNVTVMGSNSIGADGNVAILPLPGGISMSFTGLGVYTPEGGQTQRIGLSPDIYVFRTISGITEGRDELLEAAVAFLRVD